MYDFQALVIFNDQLYHVSVSSVKLKSKSEVFEKMLEHEMKEKSEQTIDLTNYYGPSILIMLEYIHTDTYGVSDFFGLGIHNEISLENELETLSVADIFNLTALGELISQNIIDKIDNENVWTIKKMALNYPINSSPIIDACNNFISEHANDKISLSELRTELEKIKFVHAFSHNNTFRISREVDKTKFYQLLDKTAYHICLIPVQYKGFDEKGTYFKYIPILERDMLKKFSFLKETWRELFWVFKIEDIYLRSHWDHAHLDELEFYGLKTFSKPDLFSNTTKEDPIAKKYNLLMERSGYDLHFAFVRSLKKYGYYDQYNPESIIESNDLLIDFYWV